MSSMKVTGNSAAAYQALMDNKEKLAGGVSPVDYRRGGPFHIPPELRSTPSTGTSASPWLPGAPIGYPGLPGGFPAQGLPPFDPRPQQAELGLLQAKLNAETHPGLQSDTTLLEAAKGDLNAYRKYEPNSPRVPELETLVKNLEGKVTKEATRQVDDALNAWYESKGTRADDQKLYQALGQAEAALQQSAPKGSEMQFVKAAREFIQQRLFPITPFITNF